MMAQSAQCLMMQVLAPTGNTRHAGFNYCGMCCANKELLYTGDCEGPVSSDVGVVPDKFHDVRVTVSEAGVANLYVSVDGGAWQLIQSLTDPAIKVGKIGFSSACVDFKVDHVTVWGYVI